MISLKQLTDNQLVTIYQQSQDNIYFGELYNRYYKKIYHYCLGKVKDRDNAYDITSDTFVKLISKIQGLRNPELFIAWLFKIANNACIDCLKSKGKTYSVENKSFYHLEDDQEGLQQAVVKDDLLNKLDLILENLDIDTKALLMERYFNGKSVRDLERELGISKSAVKMRLARGRNKIGELLLNTRTKVSA